MKKMEDEEAEKKRKQDIELKKLESEDKALNSIYGIYNLKLKRDEIEILKDIKKELYHENNDSEDIRDDNLNNEEDSNYGNDDGYFNMD